MERTPPSLSDSRAALAIVLLAICYTFPWLSALEFFRHTEADRTLIGWEMWQRKDWIVPHLLGDAYITKPPLFYQLLAAMFGVVGAPYEWSARAVSAVCFVVLLVVQFAFLRSVGLAQRPALIGVALLGFSGPLYVSSIEAEIDLLFTLLCTVCLYALYVGAERRSFSITVGAYAAAALAFLTKGPQVALFGGIAALVLFSTARAGKILRGHATGVLLATAVLALWTSVLISRVPWTDVQAVFDREVLGRFRSDPMAADRARGVFFYLQPLLLSTLPWSLALLGFCRRRRPGVVPTPLLRYSAIIIVASTVMLSCASGKSNRYLLPLLPLESLLFLEGLARIALPSWTPRRVLFTSLLAILLLRLPFAWIYAPHRNETMSVKPLVQRIQSVLPPNEPLYILEMFERWIPYYLVREQRPVYRLTPAMAERWQTVSSDTPAFLLLAEEEMWQLRPITALLQTVATLETPKKRFLLVRFPKAEAHKLSLQRIFPTVMSANPQSPAQP